MASFDFIKAAVKGYQFVWHHRVELLKFSFPVVFIGVFCELVIIQAGMEENILRRGLLDLPAVFAQGYFLAELVRYAIYGEPFVLWGYTRRSKLEEFKALYVSRMHDARRRSIIYASVILFVLQMVVADVLMGLSALGAEKEIKPPPEAMSTADVLSSLPEAFLAVLIIFAAFWSIRLGFLYVSLSLGYGIREYLYKLKGLSSSVSLFLCSFFVMLLLVFPAEMLLKLLTIIFADLPAVWVVTTAIVREYIAIILLSVVTVASAYGIKDMVEGAALTAAEYLFMKIIVVDYQDAEHELEAVEGWSVMQIIREYGLPIKAECGGACSCATCHIYVDAEWINKLPAKRPEEEERLDEVFGLQDESRLSCQIILDESLDGLRLRLAPNPD